MQRSEYAGETAELGQRRPPPFHLPAMRTGTILCLHANSGITYDLNAFRQRLAGSRILRFSAVLGILNCAPNEPIKTIADFWILTDGQVRYKTTLSRGESEPADIEIAQTDRFLTLIATDGGSQNIELDRNAIGYDWCIFGGAKLILE